MISKRNVHEQSMFWITMVAALVVMGAPSHAGDEGLAAAGRAVQQHAFGGVYAQPFEHLRVAQRQLDDFSNA